MQPQTLDQDAVNLAKSIRQVESGGNFKARGKSGEVGAYQYRPETWNRTAPRYGVNVPIEQATPEQQNEVTYRQIKEWKDQGLNPGQIASMWNSGKPDNYQNPNAKGVNQFGAEYDVPNYAKKVAETYHSIKGNRQAQQPQLAQNIPSQDNLGVNVAQAAETENKPKSTTGKVLSAVGKGVDFFLPILGDLKNITEGDNTKTGKQLLGDAALSALTFVPGAGLLTKGIKGASLAAKLARGGIRAAEGYGVGVAQNLAEGKDVSEAIKPGISTLGGAALGATIPGLIGAGSRMVKNIAGISPQIENALKNMAGRKGEAKFERFVGAAKERAEDIRKPSPQNLAADDLEKAAKKLKETIVKEGEKVGSVKKLVGNQPIKDITPVLKSFKDDIEDRFGLTISTNVRGGNIKITKLPGRVKDVLSGSDQNKIRDALRQVLKLRKNGNLQKASDVLDNLDSLVEFKGTKLAPLNKSSNLLEGFLKNVRHNLNEVIGASSDDLAKAKTRFSELKDMQRELGKLAGEQTQRGELLMRRVFSGDFGSDVIKTFEKISKETGIDLVDSAVLAKFATESVGSSADKTLLQQIIGKGQAGLYDAIKDLGVTAIQKTVANPERIGRNLVKKKGSGLLPTILKQSAATQSSRIPGLLSP